MLNITNEFACQILHWYDRHGRKNLPWTLHPTPYRVWISEVMLQQTQVATVLPYFHRFVERFPNFQALANAQQDDVLSLWSGLGYYTRARNLHKTAQIIVRQFDGKFPSKFDIVVGLPGIGKSTAAAILAQAFDQRHTILDGNVKRVFSRYAAVDGLPNESKTLDQLWQIAERYTPLFRIADYTQAIMDLGATICTRSQPKCIKCPIVHECRAHQRNDVHRYPASKKKAVRPTRNIYMAITVANGSILFEKRPPTGIWGGLWSFPEFSTEEELENWIKDLVTNRPTSYTSWPELQHSFTHFHLVIRPVLLRFAAFPSKIMDSNRYVWYNAIPEGNVPGGIAAPVKKLLNQLANEIGVAPT